MPSVTIKTRPSKRPTRPTPRPTNPTTTQNSNYDVTDDDSEEVIIPGTVREEFPPRRPAVNVQTKNVQPNNSPSPPLKVRPLSPNYDTTTKNPQNVILAAHPQDNEIASSVNIR